MNELRSEWMNEWTDLLVDLGAALDGRIDGSLEHHTEWIDVGVPPCPMLLYLGLHWGILTGHHVDGIGNGADLNL